MMSSLCLVTLRVMPTVSHSWNASVPMAVVGTWRLLHAGAPIAGVTPAMGGLAAAIAAFALSFLTRSAPAPRPTS